MTEQLRAFLERAEFEAIEITVRYYEGCASAAELTAAREYLQQMRAFVTSPEQATRDLFAFPRRAEPPAVQSGQ